MPDPIPVVILARLAVDRTHHGHGLGRAMFRDAARRVAQAADTIGIRGIVVHAISEDARRFYIALGFDPWPAEAMTLVATLRDLRAALGEISLENFPRHATRAREIKHAEPKPKAPCQNPRTLTGNPAVSRYQHDKQWLN
jgi:hypothetical protein